MQGTVGANLAAMTSRAYALRTMLLLAVLPPMTYSGCGDDGGAPTNPSNRPSIAGTYQIVQTTVTNTCGDTGNPPTVTGTVTLTGTDAFQLRDTGGTTFTGTVGADSRFVANATLGPDASGQTFTQRLEGTFTSNGFTAVLNVTVQPRNCAFTRNWTGTKI